MAGTIEINGTGGIIEGNLGSANVNVNLDAALDFDGTDDFITVADHSSIDLAGGDFTLAFWIKTDNISQAGGVRVLTKNTGSTSNFGPYTVAFNDGNNRLRLGFYNTSQHEVTIPLIASTWLHCAVVYDYSADTLNAYRNGVLVDTESSISEKPVDNSAALTFGYAGTGASYFDGKFTEPELKFCTGTGSRGKTKFKPDGTPYI